MGVAVLAEARTILKLALPSCIASLTFITGMLCLVFIGPLVSGPAWPGGAVRGAAPSQRLTPRSSPL